MANNLKWKDKLFASGIPLEFDAAKILVSNDFIVDYDYSYKRLDETDNKEFSIDLHADAFFPFDENSPIHQTVDLLVECKYRNPSKKWVFLPEILENQNSSFSTALKLVEELSKFSFESRTGSFMEYDVCTKGIEVNFNSNDAYDTGIAHGSLQLLYAMPILLHRKIHFALHDPLEEIYPFYIIPILVTTAELFVLNEDFGLETLSSAQDFKELGYKVNCLRFQVNIPPSFYIHCHNTFRDLFSNGEEQDVDAINRLNYLTKLRQFDVNKLSTPPRPLSNPHKFISSLMSGQLPNFFEEILICNISYLPELIKEIKSKIKLLDKGKKLFKD